MNLGRSRRRSSTTLMTVLVAVWLGGGVVTCSNDDCARTFTCETQTRPGEPNPDAGGSSGGPNTSPNGAGGDPLPAECAGCEIGVTCHAAGDVNPEDVCEVCEVAQSTSAWTRLDTAECELVPCPAGEIGCGGACIDPDTNADFCGASASCQGNQAGVACSSNQSCVGGACVCPAGLVNCQGACIDPLASQAFCGASADCEDANAGEACASGQVCSQGGCADGCEAAMLACAGGCIDPASDAVYCGAQEDCTGDNAGTPCQSDETCVDAVCVCANGRVDCGGSCVDPVTNAAYCGAQDDCTGANAGVACSPLESCQSGSCECLAGLVSCGGNCINAQASAEYCGASGNCLAANAGTVCAPDEVCAAGECTLDCPMGLVECDAGCIDPASDESYCGASDECTGASAGEACAAGDVCTGGACVDVTPPVLIEATPFDGAIFAARDSSITLEFSEAIDPDSVDAAALSLSENGNSVAGTISVAGELVIFTPELPLALLTRYSVSYSGILDLAGNPSADGELGFAVGDGGFDAPATLGTPNTTCTSITADGQEQVHVVRLTSEEYTAHSWRPAVDAVDSLGMPLGASTDAAPGAGACPVLASDDAGGSMVVWKDLDVLSAYLHTGGWAEAGQLEALPPSGQFSFEEPALVLLSPDSAVVAWSVQALSGATSQSIESAEYGATGWTRRTPLSAPATGPSLGNFVEGVKLAGRAQFVFSNFSLGDVFTRDFVPGLGWQAVERQTGDLGEGILDAKSDGQESVFIIQSIRDPADPIPPPTFLHYYTHIDNRVVLGEQPFPLNFAGLSVNRRAQAALFYAEPATFGATNMVLRCAPNVSCNTAQLIGGSSAMVGEAIVLDDRGNGGAVFINEAQELFFSRYVAETGLGLAQGWSMPLMFASITSVASLGPQIDVAITRGGDIVVLWRDLDQQMVAVRR